MKMLRLPRSKVQLGAPLPWNVRDAQCLLLLSRGHVVENEHQLEQLLARGAFVDVEEVRAVAAREAVTTTQTPAPRLNLFGLWDQAMMDLHKLVTTWSHQEDLPTQLDQFAQHVLELVDSNPDIAIYRCMRQEQSKTFYYGYAHAMHCALLAVLLARHLHWDSARLMSLVKAALTMNLSILDLQGQMAGQDFPMRDKQRAQIQQHPTQALAMLQAVGVADQDWLTAIEFHHEHVDGSGYPTGCKTVPEIAVVLRLIDVFMAKISPRLLRPALSMQEAARQLFREDNGGVHSTALIKEFGIFPPGDFVKLASGELAVVVQRSDNARAPIVAAITDSSEHPMSKTLRRDTAQAEFAVVGNVANKAMLARLPPERLYGYSEMVHQTDASAPPAAAPVKPP